MTIDYEYNAQQRVALAITTKGEQKAGVIALIAQAEATLALVKQTRLQTLALLYTAGEDQWSHMAFNDIHIENAAKQLKEGLGL